VWFDGVSPSIPSPNTPAFFRFTLCWDRDRAEVELTAAVSIGSWRVTILDADGQPLTDGNIVLMHPNECTQFVVRVDPDGGAAGQAFTVSAGVDGILSSGMLSFALGSAPLAGGTIALSSWVSVVLDAPVHLAGDTFTFAPGGVIELNLYVTVKLGGFYSLQAVSHDAPGCKLSQVQFLTPLQPSDVAESTLSVGCTEPTPAILELRLVDEASGNAVQSISYNLQSG
jgi:hypothetical protein